MCRQELIGAVDDRGVVAKEKPPVAATSDTGRGQIGSQPRILILLGDSCVVILVSSDITLRQLPNATSSTRTGRSLEHVSRCLALAEIQISSGRYE